MSIEDVIRETVRDAVREAVREEIATIRTAVSPAAAPANYLTTEQAAAIAGVKAETIRAWVQDGALTEHRAGRLLRVRRDDLDAYMSRTSAAADSEPSEAELERRAVSILRRGKMVG